MRWFPWPGWLGPHSWTWRRLLGNRSERIAATHLRRLGLRILAKNIDARGIGEIDILAREGDTLVDHGKRRRILAATRWLLRRHDLAGVNIRQDIVAIAWSATNKVIEIRHIRNAFQPDGPGIVAGWYA